MGRDLLVIGSGSKFLYEVRGVRYEVQGLAKPLK